MMAFLMKYRRVINDPTVANVANSVDDAGPQRGESDWCEAGRQVYACRYVGVFFCKTLHI